MTSELELMAGTLYRIIEGKPFYHATVTERANYMASCKTFIDDVKAEQSRQPEDGRKVGA